MTIGVDGGAIAVSDDRLRVGVYRVTSSLLEKLSQIDNKNNYRIYTHQGIGESERRWGKRMQCRVSPFPKGYMKLWMPWELFRHPVDVYLGLSQILPRPVLTTHIGDCTDVFSHVGKSRSILQHSGNRRKMEQTVSGDSKQTGTKYIGFVYDLGFLHYPEAYPDSNRALKRQTDDLVRRADAVLTISETVKQDLVRTYGIPGDTVTVTYPGVDARFSPFGDLRGRSRPYFLYVGALKRQKNIPVLLEAFAGFLKSAPDAYDLVLVGGDFWQDPRIAETVTRLDLEARVVRPGVVPDSELPSYYRGATAFVSPSLYEGFCLPSVEAMASGCPVIGSTTGAMPEVIGRSGLLVDPADPRKLVRAMNRIATEPELRKSLRTKGLKRARRYSWDTFARTVLSTIESAAGTDHDA